MGLLILMCLLAAVTSLPVLDCLLSDQSAFPVSLKPDWFLGSDDQMICGPATCDRRVLVDVHVATGQEAPDKNKTNRRVVNPHIFERSNFQYVSVVLQLILSSWHHQYILNIFSCWKSSTGSAPWSLGDDDVTCLSRWTLTCFCPCSILTCWHVCLCFYVPNRKWHQSKVFSFVLPYQCQHIWCTNVHK